MNLNKYNHNKSKLTRSDGYCNQNVKKHKFSRNYSDNTNDFADIDFVAISENFTNNRESLNKILNNNETVNNPLSNYPNHDIIANNGSKTVQNNAPAYLHQFEVQTFDNVGLPAANNDTYQSLDKVKLSDMEREISYGGGWSKYGSDSMSYGVVSDKNMCHNNMVPWFTEKNGYGTNDTQTTVAMDYKNELFTGNFNVGWQQKAESAPLFAPMQNLTHMHGTPVRDTDEISRYIPGRYHQKETPIKSVQVTPGLMLKPNENGNHGYHDMVRILPPTVDELRTKNRKRETYEGRLIDGMKGQKRTQQAPVMSYKPCTFKTTTKENLLPTSNSTTAPSVRDNFIMKPTDRSTQHIEYTGAAYTSNDSVGRNVPQQMRSQIKQSTNQNFKLPEPLQKFARTETIYNPNVQSYDTAFNARAQTSANNRVAAAHSNTAINTYATDTAKNTIRETTLTPANNTQITSNTMRGTVQPMDIANPTIRETTAENKLNPHAAKNDNLSRVYNNDIARNTTRETTNTPIVPINTIQNTSVYTNWQDNAACTTRETTVMIPYQTIVTPTNKSTTTPYNDIAKHTIRETNCAPLNNHTTGIGMTQGTMPLTDNMRTTMQETITDTATQNFIASVNQRNHTIPIADIAKHTIREIACDIPTNTVVAPINQMMGATQLADNAKTTTRETVDTMQNAYITPSHGTQHKTPLNDIAHNTMRETTNYASTNYITNLDTNIYTPLQDTTRNTTRETTTSLSTQNFITPINEMQITAPYTDTSRCTMRETTVATPWQNFATPINQNSTPTQITDNIRTTLREVMPNKSQYTITPANTSLKTPLNDVARTTNREIFLQTPLANLAAPTNKSHTTQYNDFARSTVRETTENIARPLIITPNHGTITTPYSDVSRTTIRETTNNIPQHTMHTSSGKLYSNLNDIARTTIRESTAQIPTQSFVASTNQYSGKTPLQDSSKHTTRETTVEIPYSNFTSSTNGTRGKMDSFNNTPLQTTIRETSLDIPYNTNIKSTVNYGKGTTFSNVATNTTLREITSANTPNNFVQSANKHGKSHAFNNNATKNTTRETMTDNRRIENTTGVYNTQGAHAAFNNAPTKQTIRETTVEIPYNTNTSGANNGGKNDTFNNTPLPSTVREISVEIPYNTNLTAINSQNGAATTFSHNQLKSTIRETTGDINRDNAPNHFNSGNGFGYMAENMYAPHTIRQDTVEDMYMAPLQGDIRERKRDDIYNAQLNTTKETLSWYRSPTACGVNASPDIENINAQLKNDDNCTTDPIIGYSYNANLDRLQQSNFLKMPVDNITQNDLQSDSQILNQLNSNPYNIKFQI